ncbi:MULTISPECIES: flagellar export protein FliJ [unclassified Beijerinckia]|uniref:flagellar export protein FliJ n=1 Tax=unclassified Beijerinckia TaxID=2638183 RepID=UPI000894E222|nr:MULTISPECIES: flagellar export protein FliJ [unclassified Beijerinckia]MDH7799554.1 flagellar FliJ protein [Beijerinckia sp. GAS462]SEB46558.1 flagellar export protein FliJ [Beijerinckia sp. 28-YEA-48]
MKSRDTLIRLKRFQADEKRRRVGQIEAMIAEFSRMQAELDREIATEEQRSGNSDPSHFAYSTYARAARGRRDNISNSANELRAQLEEAKVQLEVAIEELAKVQNLEGRDKSGERLVDVPRPDAMMLRPAGA